jgi:hypothetical protein
MGGPLPRLWREAAQAVVAVGVAGVAGLWLWRRTGTQLSVTTDIVGSTTFANFDIYHYLTHFYIAVLLVPAIAVAVYLALGRWGPLAWRSAPRTAVALLGRGVAEPEEPTAQTAAAARLGAALGVVARPGLPALVIALEVEVGRSTGARTLTLGPGVLAALAYALVVGLAAVLLNVRMRNGREAWSLANAVLALTVVPLLLLLVSASTAVTVASDGSVVHYPWLPVWLAAVTAAAGLGLIALAVVRRHWAAARVERLVLVCAVAPVLLFLLTGLLMGDQGPFNGFDDAQALVGGHLVSAHGLWPWRDLFLLHGFLYDGLFGMLGTWAFGATRWASNTGQALFVVPLSVIALFVFIVYFARRNYALVAAACAAVILGLLHNWLASRYIVLPIVLVLFDMVLRRGTWRRCLAFMASVVFTSIVTPETTLLVLGVLAILVVADLVHREPGRPLQVTFQRTIRCAVTGAAITLAWLFLLLVTGCLSGFLSYYLTTISGHELWGALPIHWPLPDDPRASVEFVIPLVLFGMTVVMLAWKLNRRSPWRSAQWVLVASATFVPLFYQVALDRFDGGHVGEVFETLVPFVVLWGMELVRFGDGLLHRFGGLLGSRTTVWPWRTVTPIAVVAVLLIVLWSPLPAPGLWSALPAHFHPVVAKADTTGFPLGYTVEGAVPVGQLRDLQAVLDRYAGPSGAVFEFVNEMGVPYFLLDHVPGARIYHVEAAQTTGAQELEIEDLGRSRPALVIFNDTTFGLPNYDGIWSMERNYLVSQYLLDHYRPLIDVQGQLVMLRNDMVATAPPLPPLAGPSRTSDLYFADVPPCNWGYTPAFLRPPGADEVARGVDAPAEAAGLVTTATGWAFDTAAGQPPVAVAAVSGGSVVGRTAPSVARPDVAASLGSGQTQPTGWVLSVSTGVDTPIDFYALNHDGTATPLGSPHVASAGIREGAHTYTVVQGGAGHIDLLGIATRMTMHVPQAAPLSDYRWIEFHSPSGFGEATVRLTDQASNPDSARMITFKTLPRVGHTVYLRVGSCIQWHGYATHDLSVLLENAPADVTARVLP